MVIQGHRLWYQIINRKLIYDFLLVINTNLPPILHRFRDIAVDRSEIAILAHRFCPLLSRFAYIDRRTCPGMSPFSPPKLSLRVWGSGPHLIYGSLGPPADQILNGITIGSAVFQDSRPLQADRQTTLQDSSNWCCDAA